MKNLLNECRKGGFRGLYAKQKLRFTLFGFMMLIGIGLLCFTGGNTAGIIGMSIAVAPIAVAIKMPEDENLTDDEKKFLRSVSGSISKGLTDALAEYDNMSAKQMTAKINEILKESGVQEDTLKKIQESIKEQGRVLTSLKENPIKGVELSGLKGEFYKHYDSLKKAIENQDKGFKIKAIDEHIPARIHTTDNTVSTTTGAELEERIGNDPNLYLKRRDRQYIHDIANVSYVTDIPEIYTFYEEGSEVGAIAVVAEDGLKPQVKLNLVKNQVEAQKAAGYIVVTEELMKWRPRAWAAVQRLFRDKVYRDYENLLTTQMLTNASTYAGTALDGTIPAAQVTDFTAIIAAILQGESLNFQPDTLVINPADKWRLALSQTNNGMFILPYIQNGGQFGLLGLRVITTNKVTSGTFLLGEAGTWFIEEESPTLRTGLVNDDLIHNRMTIVGEIFFLSYVPSNNAGAWVNGNFEDIKEALAAPDTEG